ncbi:MAG TPA: sulfatase-like hydrolase/transferase [Opitutus sp.]|nr:sulfatase-like hydrolase/transferase [Opitutus sp.]
MGNQYLNTQALDRLAARGTCLTRAYAPNPLCMPSRSSIFTGRYPHETGVTENTLIVFVSGHGKCAGAHGLSQKTDAVDYIHMKQRVTPTPLGRADIATLATAHG